MFSSVVLSLGHRRSIFGLVRSKTIRSVGDVTLSLRHVTLGMEVEGHTNTRQAHPIHGFDNAPRALESLEPEYAVRETV
jgi:hypothetical protein